MSYNFVILKMNLSILKEICLHLNLTYVEFCVQVLWSALARFTDVGVFSRNGPIAPSTTAAHYNIFVTVEPQLLSNFKTFLRLVGQRHNFCISATVQQKFVVPFLYIFIFNDWKACFIRLRSGDWLGHWKMPHFFALETLGLLLWYAMGHYPFAL